MTERFGVADELTCYYDRPTEPANVHVEVRVPGRLDEAAVRASVHAVLMAEPRVRARRAASSRWGRSYYWEVPACPDHDPVRVTRYSCEAELSRARSEFLSESPSLDRSPPMLILLACGPDGDRLILNAHHACADGLSSLRLLRQVAREYGQRAVPAGADTGLAAASTGLVAASTGLAAASEDRTASEDRVPQPGPARQPGAPRSVPRARGRTITRITSPAGQTDPRSRPGYGAVLATWDGLPAAGWLRSAGCSVNDLLITALMITIRDWNRLHGGALGAIRITMPVGERVEAGAKGQWGNRSRLTAVTVRVHDATGSAELLSDVAGQTRTAKQEAGPQVDLMSRMLTAAPLPVAVKDRGLRAALRIAGPLLCDTSLVSNLGLVEPLLFGPIAATDIWFSTSAHMPRGLSVGAVTVGQRLRLTFRYRRALFADADAAAFALRYGEVLDQLARREASS